MVVVVVVQVLRALLCRTQGGDLIPSREVGCRMTAVAVVVAVVIPLHEAVDWRGTGQTAVLLEARRRRLLETRPRRTEWLERRQKPQRAARLAWSATQESRELRSAAAAVEIEIGIEMAGAQQVCAGRMRTAR